MDSKSVLISRWEEILASSERVVEEVSVLQGSHVLYLKEICVFASLFWMQTECYFVSTYLLHHNERMSKLFISSIITMLTYVNNCDTYVGTCLSHKTFKRRYKYNPSRKDNLSHRECRTTHENFDDLLEIALVQVHLNIFRRETDIIRLHQRSH